MRKKMLLILVSFSLLISACALTNDIDTPLEFEPRVEEVPADEDPQPAGTQPMEEEMDPSQKEDEGIVLDITLTERTVMLESEDPPYEIEMRYPYMEGDSTAILPFNAEMDRLVEVVLEVFIIDVDESQTLLPVDAIAAINFLDVDYEVTYQSNGLYSVYLPITTYVASSKGPWMDSFTYNYDALNQEFLMPGNLFLPDAAYFPLIMYLVEVQLMVRDFGYQPRAAEAVLLRRDNWNFLQEGLRINFDAYEVGPGPAGPQFVLIPWEDLSDMLDLDGPAGRILAD